ncbi:hypothetical protein PSACC_01111 [Paramicrosporidium saccamoebae]|uniref:Uncharacterized protein n=1 Tax=Paramicrosporidium saccamoebae TaxID=1246581 RepID=A0A2H9TMU1_9FUNG|nr:hypothetical protein PSACC_01111 [Paramicrosporidium saccamoebae]
MLSHRDIPDAYIELNLDSQVRGEERYLMVLPYEGLSNQINGILRGFEMAQRLGRVLVIPPIVRSQHEPDSCPLLEDWRSFVDFQKLGRHVFLENIELPEGMSCYSFGKWRKWSVFGDTTRRFMGTVSTKMRLKWRPLKSPANSWILADLLGHDRFVAVAQLQHVHFDKAVHSKIKDLGFGSSFDNLEIPYTGVHWRRGDFAEACKNKKQESCLPSLSNFGSRVHDGTVWIATDELDSIPSFRLSFPNITFLSSHRECASRYFDDLIHLWKKSRLAVILDVMWLSQFCIALSLTCLCIVSCDDESQEEKRLRRLETLKSTASERHRVHRAPSLFEKLKEPTIQLNPETLYAAHQGRTSFIKSNDVGGIVMRDGRIVVASCIFQNQREKEGMERGNKLIGFVKKGKALGVRDGIAVSIFADDKLTINRSGDHFKGCVIRLLSGRVRFDLIKKGLKKYAVEEGDYLLLGPEEEMDKIIPSLNELCYKGNSIQNVTETIQKWANPRRYELTLLLHIGTRESVSSSDSA